MAGARDRLDRGSWWRLAVAAVAAPVLWVVMAFAFGLLGDRPSTSFVAVGAVVIAVVTPVGTWWGWHQRGGRLTARETRRWVEAGAVPDDVPEVVWRTRLGRFEDDLQMGLVAAALGVVVVALNVVGAIGGSPVSWVVAVAWLVIVVTSARRWVRWRRPVRTLLSRPSSLVHSQDEPTSVPQHDGN